MSHIYTQRCPVESLIQIMDTIGGRHILKGGIVSRRRIYRLFGVPMDLGQMRRGVDMGPSAIRYAGVAERLENLGHTINDLGNIEIAQPERVHTILIPT